jgi:tetratricopeptide (TPR) repeat protein
MFYTKRKSYSGRWLVKLLQAALVLGVVFFGLDAIGQWLNPVADPDIMVIQPVGLRNEESSTAPVLEEMREQSAEAQLDEYDYFNRALEHHNAYDYNEAIADYTRSIELNDNIAESWLNRGVAYEQLGQNTRALNDFNNYLMRDDMVLISQPRSRTSSAFRIVMSEAYRYDFPIELRIGDVVNIEVLSVEEDMVDPLILLVNENGSPVAGNDDVLRQDGSYISMNAYIDSYTATRSGTYTLFVSHAGGGSYGDLEVHISIDK